MSVLAFASVGLAVGPAIGLAEPFPADMNRATIAFMLVVVGCMAYAALRVAAAPAPYAGPDCSRCGHAFATGQARCPECGLAAGESTPILAQPFMSVVLGAMSGLPIFVCLLYVTLAVSGPRDCVATNDVHWLERSGTTGKFIVEIRTLLEPSGPRGMSRNRTMAPIIPRERFTVVLSPAVAGETGVPVPTMTIESSIEDGVASPSREEFDAAVAIAADGFVRTLAERTPASGPGSPTEAGVDQAEAKAVVGNLAAILRERLESGEASKPAAPQPGSSLPSIIALSTTLQSLAPPWWALILPMLGGSVPLALAWRSGRWGTGSPAERWIMPEVRGWGRIG